jgi:uncharacterized delta-60 repeat protein
MLKRRVSAWRLWILPLVILLALAGANLVLGAPLDPSGDPDTTFNGSGRATVNVATIYTFAEARASAIQQIGANAGKIVLAGNTVNGTLTHFGLVRLKANGTQDMSFGNGGEVKLSIGSSDFLNGVAVQSDDKIVAVGFASMAVNVFAIARFMPDGALDTTFGGGAGYVTVDFNGASSNLNRAQAVAIQDDGKIVVAGQRRDNNARGTDIAVARLNSDGSLDNTFGSGGKVITPVGSGTGTDRGFGVTISGSGAGRKIIVVGTATDQGSFTSHAVLTQYTSNGALDNTFGSGGIKLFDPPGNACDPVNSICGGEVFRGVTVQSDGKIVATGSWGSYATFPSTSGSIGSSLMTARFNADGSLDTTFNAAGAPGYSLTKLSRGWYTDIGFSVKVQPDGKIISLGYSDQSDDYPAVGSPAWFDQNFLFVRLNADGTRDSSYGTPRTLRTGVVTPPGVVVIDLSSDGTTYDNGYSLVLDSAGRAVGAGLRTDQATNSQSYIGAVRLNTNGSVDYTFGPDKDNNGTPDGYFYTQMLGGSRDTTGGVAVQTDGKVVLAGGTDIGGGKSNFALVRHNTNGSLDTSFGGTGLVKAGTALDNNGANAVAIQTDGKIVATGGSYGSSGTPTVTTMRFNSNGALDGTFGSGGIVQTSLGSNANVAYAIAIQSDGKILVGGSVSDAASNWDFYLIRYNSNGTLDTGFNGSGYLRMDIGRNQNYDEIHAILVQPDGKIVIGGFSNSGASPSPNPNPGSVFALTRRNANGSADNTFNGGNVVFTRVSKPNNAYAGDQIRGLALMPDGRIVAGGKALNEILSGFNAFALVRYMPNGSLDTSFGSGGMQFFNAAKDPAVPNNNSMDEITGVALQYDDKIVAFGQTLSLGTGAGNIELARFNWDDGSLDPTYATNGVIATDVDGYDVGVNGIVAPGGKAVMGATTGSSDLAALRYLGDPAPTTPGTPDLIDASDSGASNSDNITNDNTPTFSGGSNSCVTGETVILKVDGTMTSPLSRVICRNSTYSVTSAVAIADGIHSFSVSARNGAGDSATSASLSVKIGTVALPPTANADMYTTLEDQALMVNAANGVLKNDTDPDVGETLTAVKVGDPSHGALTLNSDGSFSYTPDPNFNGSDSFSYKARDSFGAESNPTTVTIDVTAVNVAPTFAKGSDMMVRPDAGSYSAAWATAISAGPADESAQALTFLVTGNTNPSLFSVAPALDANGTLTFTPAANAEGSATITVVLKDNGGIANGGADTSAPQSFTITVTSKWFVCLPLVKR